MENSTGGSLKNKDRTASNLIPRHTLRENHNSDRCTPMFTVALFTLAKTWKQPKCLSTEEWIKKIWYIYTMEYDSVIKKEQNNTFATTWMDLETVILSEVSQRQKEKYVIAHMWNLI